MVVMFRRDAFCSVVAKKTTHEGTMDCTQLSNQTHQTSLKSKRTECRDSLAYARFSINHARKGEMRAREDKKETSGAKQPLIRSCPLLAVRSM